MTLIVSLGLTVLAVFLLLLASEVWWRKKRPHDEFSRKFIHIFVGSFAAFWPFFLPWFWIVVLSIGFVVGVILSMRLHIFKSIHAVERPTWGEVFFALAVGTIAMVTHQPWIYAVALLHMSLADGLAAIVGVTWGKSTRYHVLGHAKSFVGSLTFFMVSVVLLIGYNALTGYTLQAPLIVGLAAFATTIENIAVYGFDNLAIPLLVSAVLVLA